MQSDIFFQKSLTLFEKKDPSVHQGADSSEFRKKKKALNLYNKNISKIIFFPLDNAIYEKIFIKILFNYLNFFF